MTARAPVYRGRFAPTPSGPLHLGSLLTALASWLDARHHGGRWLLRIDDLDAPRCRPEHAATIQRQLAAHGLEWDEAPRLQSRHLADYEAAFEALQRERQLYPCACTRAELAQTSLPGPDGPVYAGTCRHRPPTGTGHHAWRLRLTTGSVGIVDDWLGPATRDRQRDIGDYVVRRADGQIGYPLACVVDERAMGITDVVRGADLLGSSLRQLELFDILGGVPPRYRHVPLLGDGSGRKLSKQNHAMPIDAAQAMQNLQRCLQWLDQPVPEADRPQQLLEAATVSWQPRQWPISRSVAPDPTP